MNSKIVFMNHMEVIISVVNLLCKSYDLGMVIHISQSAPCSLGLVPVCGGEGESRNCCKVHEGKDGVEKYVSL